MRIFYCIATLLLLPCLLTSQNTWCVQTPSNNYGPECVRAYDDGLITYTTFPNMVMKLDPYGQIMWVQHFDTSEIQALYAIVETSDHGIACLGVSGNSNETILLRMDENGLVLWEKRITLNGSPLQADWLCPTHDGGGLLLGGGECTMVRYAIRLDDAGNEVWLKQFHGLQPSLVGVLWDVVPASGGGYLAAYNRLLIPDMDFGIMKFDENGNPLWAHTLDEGVEADGVTKVIPTAAGGCAMLGTSSNYSPAGQKITLTVWDGSGNLLAYKLYTDSSNLSPSAIAQTADGGFMLGMNALGADMIHIKTDGLGNIQWQRRGTLSNAQLAGGLAAAPNGMAYATGWDLTYLHFVALVDPATGDGLCGGIPSNLATINGQAPMETPTPTAVPGSVNYQNVNYVPLRSKPEPILVCGVLATPEEVTTSAITCSPNPFQGRLRVQLREPVDASAVVTVVDALGRKAFKTPLQAGDTEVELDLAGLPAGTYWVRVVTEHWQQAVPVVHLP